MNAKTPSLASTAGGAPARRIERHYTRKILSGELAPGTLLPNTREMARLWTTSATAVQRAMRGLAAAGLVRRNQRSGTRVTDRVERAVIGLLIGPSLSDEIAHYHRALSMALESRFNSYGLSTRIYDGIHPYSVSAVSEYRPLEMLKIDQRYHEFKGFILSGIGKSEPPEIRESPLPKVYMENSFRSDVVYDLNALALEVLAQLAREGRRRLLVLWFPGNDLKALKRSLAKAVAAGTGTTLDIQYCVIPIKKRGMHLEKLAFEVMERLIAEWQAGAGKQPDALLVMDDIAARAVCMSLLKHQINVPREMALIIRSMEEIELHYGMPVTRYEFSCTATANHLESLLWKQMTGEALPPLPILQRGHFRSADAGLPQTPRPAARAPKQRRGVKASEG